MAADAQELSNATSHALKRFYEAADYEELMQAMFDIFPSLEAPVALTAWFRIIFGMLYAGVFFVGLPINIGVAYLTYKKKGIDVITKIHFCNLLLANVLLCITTVPWVPISTMRITWPFGETACIMLPTLQGLTACVTTFQMAVLAMRRFFGMLYRVNNRINELINVLVVIIIWAMATTVMAPYGVFTKFSEHANRFYMIYFGIDGGTFCSEDWPNSTTTATYRISIFMVHFAFPVMILGALYLFLKHEQSQRSRSFITHDATSAQETGAQGHELERQAFDNTYMIIKAVVLLHLFWAPLDLMNISMDLSQTVQQWSHLLTAAVTFHILGLSTICFSPFLLQLFNTDIDVKRELRALMPLSWASLQQSSGDGGGASAPDRTSVGFSARRDNDAAPYSTMSEA